MATQFGTPTLSGGRNRTYDQITGLWSGGDESLSSGGRTSVLGQPGLSYGDQSPMMSPEISNLYGQIQADNRVSTSRPSALGSGVDLGRGTLGNQYTTTTDQNSQANYPAWYQAFTNGQTKLPFESWSAQQAGNTTLGPATPAPSSNLGARPYVAPPVGSFQTTEMPGFANPITVPTLQTLVNNDVYAVTGIRPPGFNELMAGVTGQNPATYDPRQGIVGDSQLYMGMYPNTPEAQATDTIQQVINQLYGSGGNGNQTPVSSLYSHPASAQPTDLGAASPSSFSTIPTSNLGVTQNPVSAPPANYVQKDPLAFLSAPLAPLGPTPTTPTPPPAAPQTTAPPQTPTNWNDLVTYLNGLLGTGNPTTSNGSYNVQTSPLGTTYWNQTQPASNTPQLSINDLMGLFAMTGLFGQNTATRNPFWGFGQ